MYLLELRFSLKRIYSSSSSNNLLASSARFSSSLEFSALVYYKPAGTSFVLLFALLSFSQRFGGLPTLRLCSLGLR